MLVRSLLLFSLFTFSFSVVGCGSSQPSSPAQDEMSAYLEENPEAVKDYSDVNLDDGDTAE